MQRRIRKKRKPKKMPIKNKKDEELRKTVIPCPFLRNRFYSAPVSHLEQTCFSQFRIEGKEAGYPTSERGFSCACSGHGPGRSTRSGIDPARGPPGETHGAVPAPRR